MSHRALLAATLISLLLPMAPALRAAESGLTNPADTLLTINAEGKSTRTPDIALVNAGVASTGRTAGQALAANADAMARVLAALKAAGLADRDIQTSNLSLSPTYANRSGNDDSSPRIMGYNAANRVSIRIRDIARAGALVDALVGAGANEVSGPEFALDQPDAALDEARLAAIASARARAALYARAAGLHVVRIVSIAEGGGSAPQPVMMRAMAVRKAATPIAAGEVALGVEVTMQFELAPGA